MRARELIAASAAALALAACGGDEPSEPARGNGADRAFAAAMIPHHESAVEMAEVAADRAESDFVKDLARDIKAAQEKEIETLREQDAELADAGVETGELGVDEHEAGMAGDVAALETAEPFDEAFLKMMIPHHEGALRMAMSELAAGKDPELRALAREIEVTQQREISEMEAHLGGDAGHGGHSG